jgi:predicted cation transporter
VAIVVLVSFAVGAATATTPVGVPLLWIAVLALWGWLTAASIVAYQTVPHPDLERRPSV